jgi:hypothetical protein
MTDIYECPACGATGELADIYHDDVDGALICRECNGDGELCLQSALIEHNRMVAAKTKPKFDFKKALEETDF